MLTAAQQRTVDRFAKSLVTLDDDSLIDAHQLASELEEQLRSQIPDIVDVVVRTEPQGRRSHEL